MDKLLLICCLFSFNVLSIRAIAQEQKYTVDNAHAHNDYLHPVPFHTAYDAGFGSIEADVFPVNGVLCVAHNKRGIQIERTLKSLYIEPLLHELSMGNTRRVDLLIDVKENYKLSLQLLIKELEPLKKYLYSLQNTSKPVTILISGERPPPAEYENYPPYIFFDDDLKLHHTRNEWKRVGLVSLSFENLSLWNGKKSLPQKDEELLKHTIDSVHNAGKKIRFWAAPDNENSWMAQMKLGVDLIGTDKIDKLADFLKKNNLIR